MNVEQFREACLALPWVTEDMPYDDTVVAFRLKGKIFGCLMTDKPDYVVLKCDAERALELRERYSAIEGAFHCNKKYWNSIRLDGTVPDEVVADLVRHAYEEVNKKLPKRDRVTL